MLRDKVGSEILSALFPIIVEAKNLTPAQFLHKVSEAGITYSVDWGRLKLNGGPPQERERLRRILHSNPDLEGRTILRIALTDSDVMDDIEERASINWVEGYSDSLYSAVMCRIKPLEETLEYNDKPDEKQASFLRSIGVREADIMNREKCPSVWIKQKPRTDWEAEKRKYKE